MPTLDFKGKHFIYGHHLTVPVRTLGIEADKSLTDGEHPALDDNLIIHGNNLDALKALMPHYAGRIKCIYIDPPYNTGNEKWVYNDNVNSPLAQAWLKKQSPIDIEDMERHDKWLFMMWPRLHLLRDLLADDGAIFISIDDNEQHHLRMLMDEIFGGENFLNCFTWINNLKGRQLAKSGAARTHEYILTYVKSIENASTWHPISVKKATRLMPDAYKMGEYEILHDEIGSYVIKNELHNTNSKFNEKTRPNLVFNIYYCPETNEVIFTDVDSNEQHDGFVCIPPKPCNDGIHRFQAWRWGKEKIQDERHNLHFEKNNSGFRIYTKIRNFEVTNFKDLITNISGSNALIKSMGIEFPNPKPVELVKLLIEIAAPRNAIVLDSFAGSGTTAHAVLSLNKEDDGNRKFILVECEDYADTITAKRVRCVINGVENATDKTLRDGLSGSFTYCTLGDPIDEEGMLTGEKLPTYETLASYIVATATGKALPEIVKQPDYSFGEIEDIRFYLIYEPTLDFLEGTESALDASRAEQIAEECQASGKKAYVYATHKLISQKELSGMNITFCQLPYNIYRITE